MGNIDKIESHFLLRTPLYIDHGLATGSGHLIPQVNVSKSKDAAEATQRMAEAGRQFEAYFIAYLLKVMRETVPEGTIANKQGAYFYSFYDEEIGRQATESGGIGIAKMVQEYAQQYFSFSPLEHSSSSV